MFTCSFNGMPAVMVARREYFHPNWPMVFGKATAMENAMGVCFFVCLCVCVCACVRACKFCHYRLLGHSYCIPLWFPSGTIG